MNPNTPSELNEWLKRWIVNVELPSRFEIEVWRRIRLEEEWSVRATWWRFMLQPAWAVAVIATFALLGVTVGMVEAFQREQTIRLQQSADYLSTVDPLLAISLRKRT